MRIAFGSDEKTALTDAVAADLEAWARASCSSARRAAVTSSGPRWTARRRARGEWRLWDRRVLLLDRYRRVDRGEQGGGCRAALCTDAATAAGARTWNDANVLVMGLRLTSADVAHEMLDAWFTTEPDPGEAGNIGRLETG